MLNATKKFTGDAAWMIFRQAEPLYQTGKFQVVLLRNNVGTAREVAVYNPDNQQLLVFTPEHVLDAALSAGITEGAANPHTRRRGDTHAPGGITGIGDAEALAARAALGGR